jgi:hypothetical protein
VRRPSISSLPAVCSLPFLSQFFLPLPYSNYSPATSLRLPPQKAGFPPPLYVVCNMYRCFRMYCLVVCVRVRKKGGVEASSSLRLHRSPSSSMPATAGCVLSSAQLNTLKKVSAVRSQRPVQAERSVFAGLPNADFCRTYPNP